MNRPKSYIIEEDICTICGDSKSSVGNLTNESLLVNNKKGCGHLFCQKCISKEFLTKRQFFCRTCKELVKKNTLSEKSLIELESQNDFEIRKDIKEIYNKTSADFDCHKDYCDYEEMVEDIIYNLVNDIDLTETKRRISEYKSQNRDSIVLHQTRRIEDMQMQSENVILERRKIEMLQMEMKVSEERDRQEKKELKLQRQQMQLGERNEISMKSSQNESGFTSRFMAFPGQSSVDSGVSVVVTRPTLIMPSHVTMFLNQREEPKVLFNKQSEKTDEEKRSDVVKYAGGFKTDIVYKRNFSEAMNCFIDINI